jgi:hypothetical protein
MMSKTGQLELELHSGVMKNGRGKFWRHRARRFHQSLKILSITQLKQDVRARSECRK